MSTFNVGDKVMLRRTIEPVAPKGTPGTVVQVVSGARGRDFNCVVVLDGVSGGRWFRDSELAPAKDAK